MRYPPDSKIVARASSNCSAGLFACSAAASNRATPHSAPRTRPATVISLGRIYPSASLHAESRQTYPRVVDAGFWPDCKTNLVGVPPSVQFCSRVCSILLIGRFAWHSEQWTARRQRHRVREGLRGLYARSTGPGEAWEPGSARRSATAKSSINSASRRRFRNILCGRMRRIFPRRQLCRVLFQNSCISARE